MIQNLMLNEIKRNVYLHSNHSTIEVYLAVVGVEPVHQNLVVALEHL